MATINGLYVFVQEESLDHGVESAAHPVERGMDLTDHVRRSPVKLSLTGEIVGPNAASTRAQLIALMQAGALVNFIGRTCCGNMQIQSFQTEHPYTISGGMSFRMTLKEVRIAQSAVQPAAGETSTRALTRAGSQQIQAPAPSMSEEKVYHTVKSGETAWYLGEKVYKANGSSVGFIQTHNPDAPRKKGDWSTLPIGARLHVYTRKGAG